MFEMILFDCSNGWLCSVGGGSAHEVHLVAVDVQIRVHALHCFE